LLHQGPLPADLHPLRGRGGGTLEDRLHPARRSRRRRSAIARRAPGRFRGLEVATLASALAEAASPSVAFAAGPNSVACPRALTPHEPLDHRWTRLRSTASPIATPSRRPAPDPIPTASPTRTETTTRQAP